MGGLGDSLLVYPVLEILKKRGYHLTVWGNSEYFSLAKIAGFCNKVTFYEPKEHFDLRIIFSADRETFSSSDKTIFVDPFVREKIWIIDYYLKSLNLEGEEFSKILNIGIKTKKNSSLCIIHPGSGSKKKNPEIDFFLELDKILKKMGFNTLYIIGPAEERQGNFFIKSLFVNNVLDLAKNLLKASLYIGLDSGVSHLSSYLGVPSVVIFGPTDPVIWHPIGENLFVIRDNSCLPCFPSICKELKCLDKKFLIYEIERLLCKNIKKLKVSKAQVMGMKD